MINPSEEQIKEAHDLKHKLGIEKAIIYCDNILKENKNNIIELDNLNLDKLNEYAEISFHYHIIIELLNYDEN